MQKQEILVSSVNCPGPLIEGKRQGGCGKFMTLKKTNDSRDVLQWRCRRVHTVHKAKMQYKVKDVKLSICYNSWLIDSRLPLENILELIYLWAQGFAHSEVMHELKLSKKTVTEWFLFFREACMYSVMENSRAIGGNGVKVEIDESKFGKGKYHRGHKVEGQWVFGVREKYNKQKIPVDNRKAVTLLPIFMIPVDNRKVNHSKEFVNRASGACTNSIESDWRHAKVHMPPYGTHLGDHAGYLAEFMWRRSNGEKDKFLTLIQDINMTFKEKYLSKTPFTSS